MPETAMAEHAAAMPKTLQPASLLKRAVVGLFTLVIGIMLGAWLLHASIQTDGTSQTAQSNGVITSAQHATSQRQ
ncbi:MAG: hypothetical protein AAF346_16435 [Pseudomonadota bacterium]